MTFAELREDADGLCEVWGYNNTPRPPDWYTLVNQAYKDFVWSTECIRGPAVDLSGVTGQPEYSLPVPDWKIVTDVYFGGVYLKRLNEYSLRRVNSDWLYAANGVPTGFWSPRKNVLRLYVPPTANGTIIRCWGVRAPTPLAADTDTMVIPDTYNPAVSLRAAWLHARKYAKSTDQMNSLNLRKQEYEEFIAPYRDEVMRQFGRDAVSLPLSGDAG